jgi:hypothetical protein
MSVVTRADAHVLPSELAEAIARRIKDAEFRTSGRLERKEIRNCVLNELHARGAYTELVLKDEQPPDEPQKTIQEARLVFPWRDWWSQRVPLAGRHFFC